MFQNFAQHAAIAAADNEHAAWRFEAHQWHMRHHFMIDKIIRCGELHNAVKHQHAAPGLIIEDHQVLMFSFDLM